MVKLNTAEELADIYETEYYTDAMTGGQDKRMYLYYQLINSLKQADSVDIVVSFLMESGVRMLLSEFENALKRGTKIRILTGNYLGITQPSALYLIKHKLGEQVELHFYNEKNRSFHPKSYIFHYKDYSTIYIGSSNISRSALTSGIEWNYRFSSKTDFNNYEKFYNTFLDLFQNHSVVIDDDELKRYSKNWHRPAVSKDLDRYDLQDNETSNDIVLFEPPFGIFRFYRKPYTMQKNLDDALRLYCDGDTTGVVVASIEENIDAMNTIYAEIDRIFKAAKVQDFMCLPRDDASCQKFKKEFSQMKIRLSSAKLQGFAWNNSYGAKLNFDEKTYKILEMRYQDLTHRGGSGGGVPGTGYNLPTILSEMAMDKIDSDYLESHFKIVVPIISGSDEDEKEKAIDNFKKELASLPGIQQVYALKIIDDIKNGVLVVDHSKTLLEYINEYMAKDTSDKIQEMADAFGLNFDEFKNIVTTSKNEMELNEHDRFNTILKTVDTNKANKYFLDKEGVDLQGLKLKSRTNRELKEFILGKKEE